jgi:hypothetical protein
MELRGTEPISRPSKSDGRDYLTCVVRHRGAQSVDVLLVLRDVRRVAVSMDLSEYVAQVVVVHDGMRREHSKRTRQQVIDDRLWRESQENLAERAAMRRIPPSRPTKDADWLGAGDVVKDDGFVSLEDRQVHSLTSSRDESSEVIVGYIPNLD